MEYRGYQVLTATGESTEEEGWVGSFEIYGDSGILVFGGTVETVFPTEIEAHAGARKAARRWINERKAYA